MTTAAILNYLAAASATGATVVALEGGPGAAQDWTVMGLLAAVVLGIGARMVAATEKNTGALAEVKTELQLLGRQLTEDRHASERLQADTKVVLESLAKEIGRRESQ